MDTKQIQDARTIAALVAERDALREALDAVRHEVAALNKSVRAGSEAAPWVCEKVSQINALLDDDQAALIGGAK